MSWRIHIPYRDREESLADVACSVHELSDSDDRAATRAIAIEAATYGGLRTAGELLDRVSAMNRSERRQLLDQAREAAGLPDTGTVEARERAEAATKAARHRAAKRPIPSCAICGASPTNANGLPNLNVPFVRKWHCSEHVAQAQPGDLDPPPSPVSLSMRLIDPDEDERERRKDDLRAEAERQRREIREHEAAERRAAQEARAERWRSTGRGWTTP